MRRPRWRIMTWVILIWITLTLIAALQFAARDQECLAEAGFEQFRCQLEARVGFRGAIGWLVIGTIVLGIVWIITQPRQRPRECPACGSMVPRGVTECHMCGHDFAAAAGGATKPPQPPPPRPRPPTPPSDIPPPPAPTE